LSNILEKLEKKLKELKSLTMDTHKTLDNLPMPKIKDNTPKPKGIEAPKAGEQASKKDPKKVAEQLKDAGNKKMEMDSIKRGADKLIKFNEYGQWSLNKNNDEEDHHETVANILNKKGYRRISGIPSEFTNITGDDIESVHSNKESKELVNLHNSDPSHSKPETKKAFKEASFAVDSARADDEATPDF
jgi:hypothetical protein